MKKVKLTTATLAMLTGTMVAPLLTHAEGTEKNTDSSVVAEETQPSAETEKTPETSKDSEEVKESTTPEAKTNTENTSDNNTTDSSNTVGDVTTKKQTRSLDDEKLKAKYAINEFVHNGTLTQDEYYEYEKQIDNAQNEEGVQNVVNEVTAMCNQRLDDKKLEAKYKINDLVHAGKIPQEDYYTYEKKIDEATSVSEINDVVTEATTKGDTALNKAKEDAKYEVSDLVYANKLPQEDYYKYAERIDAATSIDEINAIVTEAKNAADLNDAKLAAKYEINDLVHAGKLTLDDYYGYEEKIDAATSKEEIDAVVAEAKAHADLNDEKLAAKHKINELVHAGKLTLDDYYRYEEKIDAATSKEEVDAVVAEANAFVALNEAKLAAKYEINDLVHADKLTLEDYYRYEEKIDAATSIEEVNAVVAEAKAYVALNEAKLAAKYEINDLVHAGKLTLDDYYRYEEKIDAATSIEEVNAVVAEAKAYVALNEAKEAAKYEISDMVYGGKLVLDDYFHFEKLIDGATSIEEVNGIVESAKKLSETRALAADELLDYVSKGKLTTTQYKDFYNQIFAAKSADEVDAIMVQVRALVGDASTPGETEKPGDGNTPGETEKPGDGNTPGETEKPGDGNTPGETEKPGNVTKPSETEKPGQGNKPVEGSKPVNNQKPGNAAHITKVSTQTKADDNKALPQTGDVINTGLIASGLISMLSGAFIFMKKK